MTNAVKRIDEPIVLDDGGSVEVDEGAAVLRAPDGQVVCRYRAGCLELVCPDGDLRLAAPHGRVVIESAEDVVVTAERDVVHRAGRKVRACAGPGEPQLEIDGRRTQLTNRLIAVRADDAKLEVGRATMVARQIASAAESLVVNVERYEMTAERIVEQAREAVRNVSDLLLTRAGRVRTLVDRAHSLYADRHVIVSEGDTTIDGKRIHLG
jgi:hypothetical protein